MAELTQQERLQPSLIDRLTDDEPQKKVESRDRRLLSLEKLREGVLRDLAWLLNTEHLAAMEDFQPAPFVSQSVLNYGIPPLSGTTASGANVSELEAALRQAIWDFEPRILRDTVQVRAAMSFQEMNHNSLRFEIEGTLWAQPLPLQLFLRTEVDLETGDVSVTQAS